MFVHARMLHVPNELSTLVLRGGCRVVVRGDYHCHCRDIIGVDYDKNNHVHEYNNEYDHDYDDNYDDDHIHGAVL